MRLLLDTNVLLDALLIDRSHRNEAIRILRLAEEGRITALVTPMTLGTLLFVLQRGARREGPALEKVRQLLLDLLKVVHVVQVDAIHFARSARSTFLDIEDGAQFFSASAGGRLDAIITRDKDLNDHVNVPVFTALAFLHQFER